MKYPKKIISLFILSLLSLNSNASTKELLSNIKDIPVNGPHKSILSKYAGPIIAGAGFSHDTQQIPPNLCYNTTETTHTGQQGVMNLNSAISFDDLEKQLHFGISVSGGYGMFSASAESDYLRSIQDLDYSLSLNYYEYLYNTVMLKVNGTGENTLSSQGKDIYDHANKYFGILCGDDFLSSYQQGASLLMSINIRFNSHYDKEEFSAAAGGSFGNIINASAEIQSISSQYNLHGTVVIQAYQKGGDPSQLSKILSKDSGGTYYALSCDINHMDNCVKAASGLMDYAANNFSTQVSFQPEKGLTPLGTGFISHDPIAEYGLNPPPSLITEQVIADRKTLADLLKEYQYYQQKFNELLFGYPVPLDVDSKLYAKAKNLYGSANQNIDAILFPDDPDDGALKCYNHPDLCHETTQSIQSQLQPIASGDLDFLHPLINSVVLDFWPHTDNWYPTNETGTHFLAPTTVFGYFWGDMTISPNAISNINLHVIGGPDDQVWLNIEGTLNGSNNNYYGTLCWSDCAQYSAAVVKNPYYFTAYTQ